MQPSSAQPRVTAVLVVAQRGGPPRPDPGRPREPDPAPREPGRRRRRVDRRLDRRSSSSAAPRSSPGSPRAARSGTRSPSGNRPHRTPSADEAVDEWLWLIGHDNAPAPTALAEMLAAVEIAPSVAVAGPKLMRLEDPSAHPRVRREHDPAAVASVRPRAGRARPGAARPQRPTSWRSPPAACSSAARVWKTLGGFDPALPDVDAALDFCVRVRLAGHRVAVVPDARATQRRPDRGVRPQARVRGPPRAPAPAGPAAPPHDLRARWRCSGSTGSPSCPSRSAARSDTSSRSTPQPCRGELAAAVAVAFGGGVARARRALARTKRLGLGGRRAPARQLAPCARAARPPSRDVRARTGRGRPGRPGVASSATGASGSCSPRRCSSVVTLFPLLGSPALTGGGLLPLSTSVSQLWQNVGYGWHSLGTGSTGPSDPFAAVLAVLGSIVFWSPSTAVVVVMLAGVPGVRTRRVVRRARS